MNLAPKLKAAVARLTGCVMVERAGKISPANRERILYVANAYIPTLQLGFVTPLRPLTDRDEIATELLSEQQLKERFGANLQSEKARRWIEARFKAFSPTLVVFCRYSGPYARELADMARAAGAPVIYHIDDDLLNVPKEIGQKKYEFHNQPARLETVRYLLKNATLVYVSTTPLLEQLRHYGLSEAVAGEIYCSGKIMAAPPANDPVKIGYMGFDHAHDFELALPALVEALDSHPEVQFELFGSIPKPQALNRFGARIQVLSPVPEYAAFLKKLAGLGWAIGICPLAQTPFNAVKANTKWVEYTAAGMAVVATGGTIYDSCCDQGCGILARNKEEWKTALATLITQPEQRKDMVLKAQAKMAAEYSAEALRRQVLNVFEQARRLKV